MNKIQFENQQNAAYQSNQKKLKLGPNWKKGLFAIVIECTSDFIFEDLAILELLKKKLHWMK